MKAISVSILELLSGQSVTDRRTDGQTDGRTDGRTDTTHFKVPLRKVGGQKYWEYYFFRIFQEGGHLIFLFFCEKNATSSLP